ncbi:MFS transporter [Streptosporangium lutulentum]
MPPRLFHDRNFTLAQVLSFLVGAVMLSVTNYLPQYMQFVRGASPTAGGMLLLPLMFGMLGAQLTTGHLISRNGRYRLYPILGGAVMIAGALVLLTLGVSTGTAAASALTLVTGLGMGLLMQSTMLITMNSADARDMGAASGTVTLVRTIGGSLGIALLGSVYASRLEADLAERLGPEAAHRMTGGGELTPALLRDMSAPVRDAFRAAVSSGLHGILLGAAVLSAIAFAAAWFVREVPLRGEAPAQAAPRQPRTTPPPGSDPRGLGRPAANGVRPPAAGPRVSGPFPSTTALGGQGTEHVGQPDDEGTTRVRADRARHGPPPRRPGPG